MAAADSYVIIKDKNGACKVIMSDHKTPKTIAGPFKKKEEAEKAKEKVKEKVQEASSAAEKIKGKPKEKAKESVPTDKK